MCLRDRDPAAAIDWLARAFGVEPEIVVAGGAVVHHAQLRYGADLIVIGPAPDAPNGGALAHAEYRTGPGYTYLVVDDPDAHHARSIEAGARIVRQLPTEHHGSRGCTALDPEDNVWSLGTGRPSGHASGATHVRRTVPDVYSADLAASVAFYETLGLEVVMDQGWIVTLASPSCQTAQVSVLSADPSGYQPVISVEVDDADAVHGRVVAAGHEVVNPPTDEPWAVRRFLARSPDGMIVNVPSHLQ